MSTQEIKQQIMSLTPPEYQEIWDFIVSEEHDRRRSEKYAAQVVEELQQSGQLEKPEAVTEDDVKAGADIPEWQNPGTDHSKMYTYGKVVRYDGKLVRSTHDGLNCWEPGVLGFDGSIWEVVDEPKTSDTSGESEISAETQSDGVRDFVQPTGEHDAYPEGAKVTYNGAVYESLIAANAYSPDAYPTGWKKLA